MRTLSASVQIYNVRINSKHIQTIFIFMLCSDQSVNPNI